MNLQADMRNEVRTLPRSKGEEDVIAMHEHYCRVTGFALTLNLERQRVWREWLSFRTPPFTAEELSHVIDYLRGEIKIGKRNEGSLAFRNIIASVDYFEEDLGLACRWKRLPSQRRAAAAPVQTASIAAAIERDDRTPAEIAAAYRAATALISES